VDAYTLVGVKLFAGLAVTAAIVVALILFANLAWWLGLIVLAIANAAELAWAYAVFKRMRVPRA
jgi:hypothetical protein